MTSRLAPWMAGLGFIVLAVGLPRAAEPDPVKADEKLLQEAKVGVDGAALLDFFRKRILEDADRDKIRGLIKKLGDDDFRTREAAMADLTAAGAGAAPLLRQAIQANEDIEVVRRCERCLAVIDKDVHLGVPAAAARLTGVRKPDGATTVLLAYLPFADDETTLDEVRSALATLAIRDGKPDAILTTALDDKDPIRRGAAIQALIRGTKGEQRGNLAKYLQDADPLVRLQAALAFFDVHDKRSVPVLIGLLTDLPLDKSYVVEETLCRLAGDDSPQTSLSKAEGAAKKCQTAWQGWWAKAGEKIDLAKIDLQARMLGYTLVVEWTNGINGRVRELDREGKMRWSIDNLQRPVDAVVLGNDRVVIAEYQARRITMRDFKGEQIWEKALGNLPLGLQRLPNGNLLAITRNQVLELDRDGKEVATYTRPTADLFSACKTRDGRLLVVNRQGVCTRLDADNKEEKTFQIAGGLLANVVFGSVDLLPNGRLLVPLASQNKIGEVDDQGKLVWEAPFTGASAVMRLPNGHTLATSYPANHAAELDRDGKEVWTYNGEGRVLRGAQALTHAQTPARRGQVFLAGAAGWCRLRKPAG